MKHIQAQPIEKPAIKPVKKKRNGVVKATFIGTILLFIIFGSIYGISTFFDTYKLTFQPPIIIQPPVKIEYRTIVSPLPVLTPTPTPEAGQSGVFIQKVQAQDKPTDYDIVMGKKNGEILWKVYQLESQRGKTDGCREKGLFNGFGFAQHKTAWNCFSTFEEVAYKVDNWFTMRRDEGFTIEESLCFYQSGVRTNDCPYAKNYWNVK